MSRPLLAFDTPPYRLSGVVYSAQLNDPQLLLQLGDAVHRPPYKAPPVHPVLAVRPRNTLALPGQAIAVPAGGVRTGASLGLVVGRTACRVAEADAPQHIAGWLIANDLCLPLPAAGGHYRPAVRQMARDGFCPLGPAVVDAAAVPHPDDLAITLHLDGRLAWQGRTGGRVRSAARLLSDVSEFMTLQPGDVLLLGVSADAPLAQAGQAMAVAIEGLGQLHNTLVSEPA